MMILLSPLLSLPLSTDAPLSNSPPLSLALPQRLLKVLLQQLRPSHHAQRLPDPQEHPRHHSFKQTRGALLLHHHLEDPEDREVGLSCVGPRLGLDAGQLC